MIDIEEIKNMYINDQLSMNEIYKITGINRPKLKKLLISENIKLRTLGEQTSIALGKRQRDDRDFDDELKKLIEGTLLGDGCISDGVFQSQYSHGTINKQYIEWISKEIRNYGIVTHIYIVAEHYDKRGKHCSECFNLQTRNNMFFRRLSERWYVYLNGEHIKILPEDFNLSPTAMLHWWIGDGYLNKDWGWATIASQSFNEQENLRLVKMLNLITSNYITIRPSGKAAPGKFHLYLSRKAINDLLEYMGFCPVESYEYKWRRKD